MKNADPVMQDVWHAKEANAKKHGSLAAYITYLRKLSERKPLGEQVPGTGIAMIWQRRDESIMLKNFARVVREVARQQ